MLRTIHTLKCKKKKKKVNDKSGMTSLSFEKSRKKKNPYGRNVFIGILKSKGRVRGVERGQLPPLTSPKPTPP